MVIVALGVLSRQCNVIVYEQDGGAVVSIVDPLAMLSVMHNPALEPVANEARERLQRVANKLAQERIEE